MQKKWMLIILALTICILLNFLHYAWCIPPHTSSILTAYAQQIQYTQNMLFIDAQNQNLNMVRHNTRHNQSLHGKSCICAYINLKGLQKSGTSWMIASLHEICDYFCKEKIPLQYSREHNIEICLKRWHVGSYERHPLLLPHQLINNSAKDVNRLMSHFSNRSDFVNDLEHKRFCSVTAFRDPRDREVSWAYWNLKAHRNYKMIMNNEQIIKQTINGNTLGGYKQSIRRYNQYWNQFRNAELKDPMQFYNYFYEDMVLHTEDGLRKVLEFIGFYHLKGINV
eukprot:115278_1